MNKLKDVKVCKGVKKKKSKKILQNCPCDDVRGPVKKVTRRGNYLDSTAGSRPSTNSVPCDESV